MGTSNPTKEALWELSCIWSKSSPHLVLSIGTGYRQPVLYDFGLYRGTWEDGFALRILRAFLSSPSLDGEISWESLLNRLDDVTKAKCHRLTHGLQGELPVLDNNSQIPPVDPDGETKPCHY
jgi:hypothetical protein